MVINLGCLTIALIGGTITIFWTWKKFKRSLTKLIKRG